MTEKAVEGGKAKKRRNGRIDLLRFIFALVIMLHHSRYVLGDEKALFLGGSLAVEFFFLVSGYLMAVSVERENKRSPMNQPGTETWAFLKRKLRGFLPEFLIAWVIGFVFVCFAEHYSGIEAYHAFKDEIFEVLLLKMSGIYVDGIDGVVWYLSAMLLSMAILYPLLRRHYDTMAKIVCPLAAAFILGYFCQELGHPRNPTKWLGLVYKGMLRGFAEISLGVALRQIVKKMETRTPRKWLSVLAELFEIFGILYFIRYMYKEIPSNQDFFFILLLCVILCVDFAGRGILTPFYERDGSLKVTGVLAKYSGALFFSHLYFAQHINSVMDPDRYSDSTRLFIYIALSLVNGLVVMLLARTYRKHEKAIRSGLRHLLYR